MSETLGHTRDAVRRLKLALNEADEDTRYRFAFWVAGLALMGMAIIVQFGWIGMVFCLGVIVYAAAGKE